MKEAVLAYLKSNDGYVSGQAICDRLSKSRTAVWHAIEELRDLGYEIEALPRKGYRLVSIPDRVFPWEVAPHLKTERLGRVIEYHETVSSTNDKAKIAAKSEAVEGLLVVAEEQLKGKGRRGRSWSSPFARGIWSSAVLRPELTPYEAPKMALVAALATARAIEMETGLEAGVKWPNDVLVAGKKVAGILVEMDAEIDIVRYLVVGVGINANLQAEDLPVEARPHASSLRMQLGHEVNRSKLLASLLNELEDMYFAWQADGFSKLLDRIRERTLTLGQYVTVIEGNSRWDGFAQDINIDGSLLVQTPGGEERSVYAADVSIRPGGSNY